MRGRIEAMFSGEKINITENRADRYVAFDAAGAKRMADRP